MKTWKLTSFDLFGLGMTIKGAWIYKELPDISTLQDSLNTVLLPYPLLLGRYDEKQKSVVWNGNESPIQIVELDRKGHSISEDMYSLVPAFNRKGFQSGKSRALEAYRISLDDGEAIVIQGAHALMDGATFYRIVRDWGKVTSGVPADAMKVNQDFVPDADALSKEQTLARVQELGWTRIGFKSLFRMMFNLVTMKMITKTCPIEVSQKDLTRMREESGAGTNAVLCQLAVSRLLEKLPAKESFTLLEVVDLRGRACGVPDDFFGNLSQPVIIGKFGRNANASEIHNAISSALSDNTAISENIQLSVCSSRYGLPYFMFDASDMNSRDPELFYVNNQLKFKACEFEFGTGLPVRVQQAMLPDMIKFWQERPGGPVQIIYGGFASKIMKRKQ